MGLLELIKKIFELIVSVIAGLFITNSVNITTPPTASNNADVQKNGSNYTVNKNSEVTFSFKVKGYKGYKIATVSGSTGKYSSTSICKKPTDSDKVTLEISSSHTHARNAKIVVYENEDCSGTSKEYLTPSVSYKAPTQATLAEVNKDGVIYLMVQDKSNGAWKNIGTQGHTTSTCNCYTKAYAMSMIGEGNKNPNRYGTDHDAAVNCWNKGFAGDNYVLDDRHFVSTTSAVFNISRDALKEDGLPTMVLVKNSSGGTHYLLVIGIKKASINKISLSYDDFWVVDPVGSSSSPSTNEDPKERNWGALLGSAGNRELKWGSNKAYEVTEKNK